MNYSIWAILVRYTISMMPALGESAARCFPVTATRRHDWSQMPVPARTTLRAVTVVLRAFTAFGCGRSSFAPAGSPLILPDIGARVSERIFFPSTTYPDSTREHLTGEPLRAQTGTAPGGAVV